MGVARPQISWRKLLQVASQAVLLYSPLKASRHVKFTSCFHVSIAYNVHTLDLHYYRHFNGLLRMKVAIL